MAAACRDKWGVAAVVATLTEASSHLTGGLVAALLVLTYASQYSRSAVSKLQERLRRPERWFILNIAQSAAALTDAHSKIASLWGMREEHAAKLARELNVLARSQRL
jgi:hypothetical protein